MKNPGKQFEEDFKKSVPPDTYYYRLRDGTGNFDGQKNDNVRFQMTNDYDCLLYRLPMLYCLELKSTKGTSIGMQEPKGKTKMIKQSQIKGLTKAGAFKGICAGFILNWRTTVNTYFLSIHDFNRYNSETTRKSINEKDVIGYGGIVIAHRKLQVNFRYDVDRFMKGIET